MRITKETIDSVKRSVDLIEVIESHGVHLKKKGANYVGLCPFHKEKTPSFTVNPKTNLLRFSAALADAPGTLHGNTTKDTISALLLLPAIT